VSNKGTEFAILLMREREAKGLTRIELARDADIDPTSVYRLETGSRKPSRDTAMKLASALGLSETRRDALLTAAGFAPVSASLRTAESSGTAQLSVWAEPRHAELGAGFSSPDAIRSKPYTSVLTEASEASPTRVRMAVFPVSSALQVLAAHTVQRLLADVLVEAIKSGLTDLVAVLPHGVADPICAPLAELLSLVGAPPVRFRYVEQPRGTSLGDAILQVEDMLGDQPFAVAVPGNVFEQGPVGVSPLDRLLGVAAKLSGATVVGAISAARPRLIRGGVVQVQASPVFPRVFPAMRLAGRPNASDAICQETLDSVSRVTARPLAVAGRFILSPSVFRSLRALSAGGTVELMQALEDAREQGHRIYACELTSFREDLGELSDRLSVATGRAPG
jgi:transcriptional regulator with XRE-family HTH domain